MDKRGRLFVVGTPIGNLQDMTQRAVDVLSKVNFILSEDTRESKKLLDAYKIQNAKQISYRDENHKKVFPMVLDLLSSGNDLALVSDSGTPLISDPGFKLVAGAIDGGFEVVAIPGPSAIAAALSISGLPTDKFSFLGFLPKSSGQRSQLLKTYGMLDSTLVIYESPFRVNKLLEEINATLGNRYVCLCKELTKVYEECVRGSVQNLLNSGLTYKGEYVVLVAKEGYALNG